MGSFSKFDPFHHSSNWLPNVTEIFGVDGIEAGK